MVPSPHPLFLQAPGIVDAHFYAFLDYNLCFNDYNLSTDILATFWAQ